jgi:uncharacterized membrane protein
MSYRTSAAVLADAPATEPVLRAVRWLNPFFSSPGATLETMAWLDSFEPSLMPRTSALQGVVGGLSVLSARAVTGVVERVRPQELLPGAPTLSRQLGARAGVGLAGLAVSRLPELEGESLWRAGARTSGRLLWVGSVGGAIHDLGVDARERVPSGAGRPIAVTAVSLAAVSAWAARLLTDRTTAVEPWPVEQRSTLPSSLAATAVTTAVGTGLFRAFLLTRGWWLEYLGDSVPKQVLARSLNAGVWAVGLSTAYNAGVGYVGRANEKVEPGYDELPETPLVSGSPESVAPFTDLGQQGRRYVTDVVTPEVISEVMEEEAVAHPIRVFVGYNTEPLYQTGRAELALEELERTGAYDRRWLLLVAPTGTGWVDQTMIETAEFLSRGDLATACIQYGRFPSFLSIQKVALGRSQFRLLLLGVRQRLRGMPPERRPKVLVFGESLGAWSSSDVVMYQGIAGFDHYGIDTALWVGLPGLAKWSRNGMTGGRSELVPPGTVRLIDHPDELAGLSESERERLRAVILSHDNDPIAQLAPELLIKAPEWLTGERGRGVPAGMRWRPFSTFWHTAIDAANAMVTVPGEFRSYGHDYRADMARVVRDTYGFPDATDDQLARIEAALRVLEVERARRIAASREDDEEPPAAPMHRPEVSDRVGGVPLKIKRTRGAAWFRRRRA